MARDADKFVSDKCEVRDDALMVNSADEQIRTHHIRCQVRG
jgi:hypothetical protein